MSKTNHFNRFQSGAFRRSHSIRCGAPLLLDVLDELAVFLALLDHRTLFPPEPLVLAFSQSKNVESMAAYSHTFRSSASWICFSSIAT